MAKITTPTPGFTGQVVGVAFVDGVGQTDSEGALAYFARHGYGVQDEATVEVEGIEPGEAVNEVTGEVTPAGEPLPAIGQESGDPLPEPEPEQEQEPTPTPARRRKPAQA
jgi:hypothetical protein